MGLVSISEVSSPASSFLVTKRAYSLSSRADSSQASFSSAVDSKASATFGAGATTLEVLSAAPDFPPPDFPPPLLPEVLAISILSSADIFVDSPSIKSLGAELN